ncbi:hypothetical protein E1A91_D04G101000v1 [Gossypium mustelinum]|uniref:USP domain-containing protein n=1 Tax=Gossypium mustelinum TaxID=34275 RepID=A0A5D2VC80_GOSMU|nr:hypothetical protein E1A91_D04G101000v1 [Gossypium mustelinum]
MAWVWLLCFMCCWWIFFHEEELRYQLFAVVKHFRFKPTFGHYVCYIRSSPNMWHKMNDLRVTCVEEEAVDTKVCSR